MYPIITMLEQHLLSRMELSTLRRVTPRPIFDRKGVMVINNGNKVTSFYSAKTYCGRSEEGCLA